MEDYQSTTKHRSITHPDVEYALHKMSHGRRSELRLAVAEIAAEMRQLYRTGREIEEEIEERRGTLSTEHQAELARLEQLAAEQKKPFPILRHLARLGAITKADARKLAYEQEEASERMDLVVQTKANPAWLRWGLARIDGLLIDGQPATIESFLAAGPGDLQSEILAHIQRAVSMSDDELKNLPSPTTSNGVEAGTKSSTSAPTAAKLVFTEHATAAISPI